MVCAGERLPPGWPASTRTSSPPKRIWRCCFGRLPPFVNLLVCCQLMHVHHTNKSQVGGVCRQQRYDHLRRRSLFYATSGDLVLSMQVSRSRYAEVVWISGRTCVALLRVQTSYTLKSHGLDLFRCRYAGILSIFRCVSPPVLEGDGHCSSCS